MKLQLPEFFSLNDAYACYRPHIEANLDQAIGLVDKAIRYCRLNGIDSLLVNITRISGFPPPSVTDRYLFTKQWAETARGQVVVSMVAPNEMIDPDKIGVTMAGNRGLYTNVFTDESDAIEWLLANFRR